MVLCLTWMELFIWVKRRCPGRLRGLWSCGGVVNERCLLVISLCSLVKGFAGTLDAEEIPGRRDEQSRSRRPHFQKVGMVQAGSQSAATTTRSSSAAM